MPEEWLNNSSVITGTTNVRFNILSPRNSGSVWPLTDPAPLIGNRFANEAGRPAILYESADELLVHMRPNREINLQARNHFLLAVPDRRDYPRLISEAS